MPDLGKKYTCYSCHTKFYDLGKAVPICPKCGAELIDSSPAELYQSMPPQKSVYCTGCKWNGFRIA